MNRNTSHAHRAHSNVVRSAFQISDLSTWFYSFLIVIVVLNMKCPTLKKKQKRYLMYNWVPFLAQPTVLEHKYPPEW